MFRRIERLLVACGTTDRESKRQAITGGVCMYVHTRSISRIFSYAHIYMLYFLVLVCSVPPLYNTTWGKAPSPRPYLSTGYKIPFCLLSSLVTFSTLFEIFSNSSSALTSFSLRILANSSASSSMFTCAFSSLKGPANSSLFFVFGSQWLTLLISVVALMLTVPFSP